MMFNVPQYIDIEDKVAGPLTAKQLMWMIGMGALLMVLWNIFPPGGFFVIAIPTVVAFVALAFYRPHGMSLIDFVGHSIFFLFRPKVYMWNRPQEIFTQREKPKKETKSEVATEIMTPDRVTELSRILDRPHR
jgi:hypothetical protein